MLSGALAGSIRSSVKGRYFSGSDMVGQGPFFGCFLNKQSAPGLQKIPYILSAHRKVHSANEPDHQD